MSSRIQIYCLITFTVCLWAGLAGAGDVASKCEAAMDRAAGRYSKCLLGADARNAKKENASKLAKRQARCDAHFERDTNRAIDRYGADACPR